MSANNGHRCAVIPQQHTKCALIHWNDIGVVVFCSNLKSVTDLKAGLLSSMLFSGFALSYGGGQNFLVSNANLEIRVGADKSALIHWNEIGVAAFYSNFKCVTVYRLKCRLITVTVTSSRNENVCTLC